MRSKCRGGDVVPKDYKMISISYQQLINTVLSKGYIWFTKPYDMNVIGIRNPNQRADKFDDTICVAYKEKKTTYGISEVTTTNRRLQR